MEEHIYAIATSLETGGVNLRSRQGAYSLMSLMAFFITQHDPTGSRLSRYVVKWTYLGAQA